MGMPIIIRGESTREQAVTDIIQSVALQEAALAHIMNAEGEKMQTIIRTAGVSPGQLLTLNRSVTQMINAVTQLEITLQAKVNYVSGFQTNGLPNLPIFNIKFPVGQVLDCQRSPAFPIVGQQMTLFGFRPPISTDKHRQPILSLATNPDGYFKLSWSVTEPFIATFDDPVLTLDFYAANGEFLERVATWGRIVLFFDEGFLYLGDEFSGPNPENYGSIFRGSVGYVFFYDNNFGDFITVTVEGIPKNADDLLQVVPPN
ncbi:MAG: hypothetical protein LBD23_20820 [Oscillospiraceae bacterium]|nr:hypothetical protein [Oscillospiraceae bacterium]